MSGLGYVGIPISTDWSVIAADALDYLTANLPGFKPEPGHLAVWTIAAVARLVAQDRDVWSRVQFDIYRTSGQTLHGIPPLAGAPATVAVTFTAQDAAGYTVPAGTLVAWPASGTLTVAYRTTADIVIAANTTTASGIAQALTTGSAANGYGPGPMVLVDSLTFITAVSATDTASGGADAETTLDYINRLSAQLQLLGPHVVAARDFAIYAVNTPGVARATAIDGYNPADASMDNERMVAVAGVDVDGNPLPSAVKSELASAFAAIREVNFVVNIIDPTYTPIAVDFAASLAPGADADTTKAAVTAAVASFMSPATFAGGDQTPPVWSTGETTIRLLDLAAVIKNVFGVAHVTSLTLNGAAHDVTLAGVAPLPQVGLITGVVA